MSNTMDVPKIEYTENTTNGIIKRTPITPVGWVLLDSHRPHSCPWDTYGNSHCRDLKATLQNIAGITAIHAHERHTNVYPIGSGSGGSVRFGDSMMPGVYHTFVCSEDQADANRVLSIRRLVIDEWLFNGGKRPAECFA